MLELNPETRIAGVLAPLFALRGTDDLGIGDTAALAEFGRWAAQHGLTIVQILPVNESGGDNSPYNIISSMAIDPTTIATTPAALPELSKSEFHRITARHDLAALRSGPVRYSAVRALKHELLRSAYQRFLDRPSKSRTAAFDEFRTLQADWLDPYVLYRALVARHHDSEIFGHWEPALQSLESARVWRAQLPESDRAELDALTTYYAYVQWIAFSQWQDVRAELNALGVALMGDVPVGVSIHSCDVWSEPSAFDLTRSSGAPPERTFQSDPFTMQWGQNWGFPLYDWQAMSRDNFAWWRRRLRAMFAMFDLVRVDHALGFFRIYSFPWRPEQNFQFLNLSEEQARALTGGPLPGFIPRDDSSPENRNANLRHGEILLRIMLEETGPHRLIAEDLGSVPPYVRPALESLQIPGFKIPQWESDPDGQLTPASDYPRLSLACYATHDHAPVRIYWDDLVSRAQSPDADTAQPARTELLRLATFLDRPDFADPPRPFDQEIHSATMRTLMAGNSWLAVPMITDILGTSDRFNVPGAIGSENWTARLSDPLPEIDRKYAPELDSLSVILSDTERLPH